MNTVITNLSGAEGALDAISRTAAASEADHVEDVIAQTVRPAMPSAAGHAHVVTGIVLAMLKGEGFEVVRSGAKLTGRSAGRTYSREQVTDILCEEIDALGGRRAFAALAGVNDSEGLSHLGHVLNEGLVPGPPVLSFVGFEHATATNTAKSGSPTEMAITSIHPADELGRLQLLPYGDASRERELSALIIADRELRVGREFSATVREWAAHEGVRTQVITERLPDLARVAYRLQQGVMVIGTETTGPPTRRAATGSSASAPCGYPSAGASTSRVTRSTGITSSAGRLVGSCARAHEACTATSTRAGRPIPPPRPSIA